MGALRKRGSRRLTSDLSCDIQIILSQGATSDETIDPYHARSPFCDRGDGHPSRRLWSRLSRLSRGSHGEVVAWRLGTY